MKKIAFLLLLFSFIVQAEQTSIPLPLGFLSFKANCDKNVFADSIISVTDRFGEDAAAAILKNSIWMPYLESTPEMTFTFWLQNKNLKNSSVFGVYNEENQKLIGFSKHNGYPTLDLYHRGLNNTISADRQRLWDSCKLDQEGWYFIAISCSHAGTNIFIYPPTGNAAMFYSAFVPDLSQISYFSFGDYAFWNEAIDDFKVYGNALEMNQCDIIHKSEASLPFGTNLFRNAEYGNPLFNTVWYNHCVGECDDEKLYVFQIDNNYLASINSEIALVDNLTDSAKWHMLQDVSAKGSVYFIENFRSCGYISYSESKYIEETFQQKKCQGWTLTGNNEDRFYNAATNSITPSDVDIVFDSFSKRINVNIENPDESCWLLTICNDKGITLHSEKHNTQNITSSTPTPWDGVIIVSAISDNHIVSKKINLTK